jgi:glutathione peroxidase
VEWNFEKFLIGRDGRVLARYPSGTRPDDKGLMGDIADAISSGW